MSALATITQTPVAITPMEMLSSAITRGDSLDKLERLMDLNDRWEKAQAKKAFIEAKAAFKASAPVITKDKTNSQYNSRYASIGSVVNAVNEALSKHGLDADWQFDQSSGIRVTCILTHVAGHSESVSLVGTPDTSGAKNPLQQIKSTLTYLKLATFEAVTGIATKEGNRDDDGNASGVASFISDEQVEELTALITETKTDIAKFLEIGKVESLSDITSANFGKAKALLLSKKQKDASK
jgi:hypothetical protein